MGDHDVISVEHRDDVKPECRWRASCRCEEFHGFGPTREAAIEAMSPHFDRMRYGEIGKANLPAAREALEGNRTTEDEG